MLVDEWRADVENARDRDAGAQTAANAPKMVFVENLLGSVRISDRIGTKRAIGTGRQPVYRTGRRQEQMFHLDFLHRITHDFPNAGVPPRVLFGLDIKSPVFREECVVQEQRRRRVKERQWIEGGQGNFPSPAQHQRSRPGRRITARAGDAKANTRERRPPPSAASSISIDACPSHPLAPVTTMRSL